MQRPDTISAAVKAASLPRLPPPRPLPWIAGLLAGRTNRLVYDGWWPPVPAWTTFFDRDGTGNEVRIGRRFRTRRGLGIWISGNRNRVEIGEGVTWSGTIKVTGDDLVVSIGNRSDAKRAYVVAYRASVRIGADCLLARNVELRTSDIHPILDIETGIRLNPAADVTVGDRVWIGLDSVLLKGAAVADDTVVGMRSLVTGSFAESHCVLAGAPARIVRRQVAWTRGETIPPRVPADFDADLYLALHPDVRAAGVDPVAHYVFYGFHERRRYR